MTVTKADSGTSRGVLDSGASRSPSLCPACGPPRSDASRSGEDRGRQDRGEEESSLPEESSPPRLLGPMNLAAVADRSAAASFFVSGLGLAVLPKCPLCLVGHGAAFAMLGISASSLGSWRTVLGAVMVSALVLLLIRLARIRLVPKPRHSSL